jgi:hypothetical protein
MGFQMVAPVAGRFAIRVRGWSAAALQFFANQRDSTGAEPPEKIATSSGERSTIDGKINEHSGWLSTTFTNR